MPQHSKKTRKDVLIARQPEETFIAKIERPNLDNRGLWVQQAYARGVSLPDIVRGSGLNVTTIYKLCGLDIVSDRRQYDDLCRLRNDLILKNR